MRLGWAGRRGRPDETSPDALVGAVLGDLQGPLAIVDEGGRVDVGPGNWRLEWGVGAQDRWRVAHDEVAVRQHRVEDAPVYATWMRVPGGDVIQRTAAVSDGIGRALLFEFENASSEPVAIAMVARQHRGGTVRADADHLSLDGVDWLRVERPAGGVVAGAGDLWPAVTAGPDGAAAETTSRSGAAGGLVVALPHRQKVRFVAAVEGGVPTRWPTPDDVASGWRTLTAGALEVDFPDPDLGEAWRRILPDLVVQAGSVDAEAAAEAAVPLDAAGLPDEADRARARVVESAQAGMLRGTRAVAALRALASRDNLGGAPSGLDELAGPLAAAAGDRLDATTLEMVARALDSQAPHAAADARRLAGEVTAPDHGPGTAAAVAAASVLGLVVDPTDPGALALLPSVPREWRGGSIDVRGLVTERGRVSFSVRWHGDRPALLWERLGGPDGVVVTAPGLDPTWRSTDRSGEALLAAPRG